jgi:hypothetical protein
MISTSHLLIGASVGAACGNPYSAFVGGVISHFVADAIPHTDPGTVTGKKPGETLKFRTADYVFVAVDLVIGISLVAFFASKSSSMLGLNMAAGAFGAIAVDLIDNNPFISPFLRKLPIFKQLHQVHEASHTALGIEIKKKSWYYGVATQIISIGLCIFFLSKLAGVL